jgi:hypothetical protein
MFWFTDRMIGLPFWRAAIIGWLMCPIIVYILGFAEGRWLHWRDQFRAFMPGNFLLGGALGAMAYLLPHVPRTEHHFYQLRWWWVLPILVSAGITIWMNQIDIAGARQHNKPGMTAKTFSWRQLLSPTKRWHNDVVYVFYIYLFGAVGSPALLAAQGGTDVLLARLVLVLCVVGWGCCAAWDVKFPKHSRAHVPATAKSWMISSLVIAVALTGFLVLV